ncbi:MAG: DUF3052 domain-containing protein [Planctomycetota bacterium]|nr:DUF3052 domain-containing protein [Planctomycetota bacterium]
MPAGYSGTPLIKKLGLKSGMRVCFQGDPEEFLGSLGPLPDDVTLLSRPGKDMDYLHLFTRSRTFLERRLPGLIERLAPAGMLWISWPKKASKVPTDVTEDVVRGCALAGGVVDVKVCAVDEVWSGLKLVRRLRDR